MYVQYKKFNLFKIENLLSRCKIMDNKTPASTDLLRSVQSLTQAKQVQKIYLTRLIRRPELRSWISLRLIITEMARAQTMELYP